MLTAGVIGWPVAHSKSPLIHRFWLAKLGIDGDYSRFAVHPDNLGDAIRALPKLGLRGVNVTVPHKVAVMAHLDAVDPDALAIGAVNTLIVAADGRLAGLNTDDAGFLDPLKSVPAIAKATVIGAGGAARAVLSTLRVMGVPTVTLVNRSEARALELAQDFPAIRSIAALTSDYVVEPTGLLVNATSLGMIGQPALAVDLGRLTDKTIVYDLVYVPLETPLLAAARRRGLRTIDGLSMLIGQAAVAFQFFYGAPAPREHDAELRALLTA